jgi:uncharacterized protein with FMN-binding domain
MKNKRWIWITPLAVLGMMAIAAAAFALQLSRNMATIRAIDIAEVDLTTLADGTYRGTYYFEDQIGATLDVTILDHQITDIVIIEHLCGKGTIAESILDDIVSAQTLDVDAVAGATTSSHVLKLAIASALKGEEQ